MDRSFLSDAAVVKASRKFVCIRLATYEDQAEADFLTSIYRGRSGQMENTTFAVLSPDGKRKLTAAGRGPFHEYRNSRAMAQGMTALAKRYRNAAKAHQGAQLPVMKSLDVALNVAAADGLPLIVSLSKSDTKAQRLNEHLNALAWEERFAGQFIYAAVSDEKQLKALTGVTIDEGVLLIEPGQFGLSGKVLKQQPVDGSKEKLTAAMKDVVASFPREAKDHNAHVRLGIQLGVEWESEIPETDQQSLRAKERVRGR